MIHFSLSEIVSRLWSRRGFVGTCALTAMMFGAAIALVVPKEYRAYSSLAPEQAEASLGRLAGLAAQFGVPVGGGLSGAGVDFLARVVESRELLSRLALRRYEYEDEEGIASGTFLDLVDVEADTEIERLQKAVELLREQVLPGVDVAANILTIETRASRRGLAEVINRAALDELNAIGISAQQAQAAAEAEFLQERRDSTERELRNAEEELKMFLQRNRTYQSSPELVFEASRLERRVELHQQVFVTLSQGLEQARLSAVRNTPMLTIIDEPEGSGEPRGVLIPYALIGLMLGLFGGTLVELAPLVRSRLGTDHRALDQARSV